MVDIVLLIRHTGTYAWGGGGERARGRGYADWRDSGWLADYPRRTRKALKLERNLMICIQCGKEFDGQGRAKYCSGACKVKHHRVTIDSDVTIATSDVTIDSNTPCKVVTIRKGCLDVEKDLKLSMDKDLGITGWTEDGIFIKPEITVDQVRNISRMIHAKNGWGVPVFYVA